MTMEMIRTPGGRMPAYVAVPTAAGPWPGVVVIYDFGGMSRDLRNQADWLVGLPSAAYGSSKGSLHFPVDDPLPEALVRKLLEMRMAEAFGKG